MTAVALAEKVKASERTIARDLEAMTNDGVEIVRDGPRKTGVYRVVLS